MVYEIGSDESVSDAVVAAVAEAEDVDPTELPVLYRTVDTDALDALFAPLDGTASPHFGRITFEYSTSRLTIDNGESITVEPATDTPNHPRSEEP